MTGFGSLRPLLAGLAVVIALGGALGGPAIAGVRDGAPDKREVDLDYAIYFGGIEVIELDVGLALDGAHYGVEAAMKTRGFVARMLPWSLRASSKGRLDSGRVRPQEAHSENTWRGKKGWVTLRFDDRGPRVVSAKPVREPAEIPPDEMRDALDVASAILYLSRTAEAGRACDTRVPVFDGRRRFDFVLDRLGEQQMVRDRYSAFTGTALACQVSMQVLHGKKRERDYGGFGSQGRTATIWLATIFEGVPPMLVRIEYDTRWGLIIAHLAEAKLSGAGRQSVLKRVP